MTTSPPSPRVTIVTVTYNSEHVIRQMLEPLADQADLEILVVDNGSSDRSIAVVREIAPNATVLERTDNPGFAVSVNQAAAQAQSDYLLLLNPDARLARVDLDACVSVLDRDSLVGIVAPLVRHPLGRLKTLEAGRDATVWRMLTHWSGVSRLSARVPQLEGMYLLASFTSASRDVDWVSGACLLTRRDLWQRLGGLSERWFMYAEDIDYCLRAQDAGHRVRLLMEATAEHAIGGSSVVAGEPAVSSAWLLNLYDLYKLRHRPSLLRSWSWRTTAVAGMRARSVAYRVMGRMKRDSQVDWVTESRKFAQHAQAISAADLR